jgi:hypothetical protein
LFSSVLNVTCLINLFNTVLIYNRNILFCTLPINKSPYTTRGAKHLSIPISRYLLLRAKAKKKYMCVYCHMSRKSRVGRSGLLLLFFFLLSTKPEIVVPGSGIRFRYLIFENYGKMTNCAVVLPSLLSISTKS